MILHRVSNLIYNIRLKWIWLYHTYTFNWAHRPLCDRFKSGVLQVGRLHLCRSCMFAYIGIVLGIFTSLNYSTFIQQIQLIWLLSALSPVIFLSYPTWYKKLPRFIQDALRLTMGIFIGISPFLIIYQNYLSGITTLIVMSVFWWIYFRQRQIRKRHACDKCPELDLPEICSGFKEQAAAIRLYEIQATEFMYKSGRGIPPEVVRNTRINK